MTKRIVWWCLFLALVVGFWEASLQLSLVSPASLAHPYEVLRAIPMLFLPGSGLEDVTSTLTRSFAAFALSVPIGLFAGVIIFFSAGARYPAQFTIDFLRSIPATALAPLFLVLYGVGDTTKIAVGAFSSALVICLSTIVGLQGRSPTRATMARLLGLRGIRRIFLVDIPESAPQIFLGFRTGISLALILVVVSEMLIGSNQGLGKLIADMRYTDDMPRLYAAMIVAGVIGYIYNLGVSILETKVLHWRGAQ